MPCLACLLLRVQVSIQTGNWVLYGDFYLGLVQVLLVRGLSPFGSHMHIYIYTHIYRDIYTDMYVLYNRIHIYICTYIYVYMYIDRYTYNMFTYLHVYLIA